MDKIYNIQNYTERELLQILDLDHPTDRELEAKIIQLLDTYKSSPKMYQFFLDIYQHFFDIQIEDQEEERRLFYVALTRARKKLMLSYAMMRTIYGEQTFNEPSEFLADIPNEIMEKEDGFGGAPVKPIKTVYLDW